MREILFKGQRTNNNEWVEGFFLTSPEFDNIGISVITAIEPRKPHYVFKNTVGQYTGLTDKNGKRIFEGDILNGLLFLHPDRRIFQVGYEDNGFYFFDEDEVGWHPEHIVDCEVIGNIHDNPELLKGE